MPSYSADPRAGYSLLEVLVTLSIIALVSGVVLFSLRAPSPEKEMLKFKANLQDKIQSARLKAIRTDKTVEVIISEEPCGSIEESIFVYSDGTLSKRAFCVIKSGNEFVLKFDPITGSYLDDTNEEAK